MKEQRTFYFDADLCMGCQGCVAACKNTNQTKSDLMWRTVHKSPELLFLSMACNHCENPPCLQACPTKSYFKRETDGVVIHNPETCMGCRYCQMACPYGAIKWNPEQGIVSKCHFCFERLDEGLEPACVQTCFAGALTQRLSSAVKEKGCSKNLLISTWIEGVDPSIRYIQASAEGKPDRMAQFPPPLTKEAER